MLHVNEILHSASSNATGIADGRYVPSRPIQFNGTRPGNQPIWDRLCDAWKVLSGKADAVNWEGQ
jgi:hypothetical protein